MLKTPGFIIGFSTVFGSCSDSVTAAGQVPYANRVLLTRISGLVVLAMALFLLGSLFLKAPWLYQRHAGTRNWTGPGPRRGPVAGVAFARLDALHRPRS